MAEKHEHHEDERKLERGGALKGQPESDTPAPQKQEWPEEVDVEGKKKPREGGALANDAGMQGRNPAEQDRIGQVGSDEAKAARGIEAHEEEPGRAGGPGRQGVEAPTEKLDRVSSYEGSLSKGSEKK